jgi:hypothetical protein
VIFLHLQQSINHRIARYQDGITGNIFPQEIVLRLLCWRKMPLGNTARYFAV